MLVQALLCGILLVPLSTGSPVVEDERQDGTPQSSQAFNWNPNTCVGKWRDYPESTMCVARTSPGAGQCGVSEEDKRIILAVHNELRAAVSPPHRNMMKMYWNDDLAAVAQKWASVCSMSHDTGNNREVPGWGKENWVGQSWAAGGLYNNWEKAIRTGWHSEVKNFVYGSRFHRGVVGHYTQLVRDGANTIGCGKCMCDNGQWPYYICNYYMGNSADTGRPYMTGSRCGDCGSGRCTEGVCDCGATVCKHNGTMDLQTCRCDCQGRWTGADCGYFDCPATDGKNCGVGKFYDPSKCRVWSNVPGLCPYMCGLCPNAGPRPTDGPVQPTQTPPAGGCTDKHAKCAQWAGEGYCLTNQWMQSNCRLSCSLCTPGGGGSTGSPTVKPPPGCRDKHERCAEWAGEGECLRNAWMLDNCQVSCGTCPTGSPTIGAPTTPAGECVDNHSKCPVWAEAGKCTTNPWMPHNCRLSCKLCTPPATTAAPTQPPPSGCRDTHAKCKEWAAQGQCAANKIVQEICKASCGLCATTPAPTPPPTQRTTQVCTDTHPNCKKWSSSGECKTNKVVQEICKASCGLCGSGGAGPPTTAPGASTVAPPTSAPGCKDLNKDCKAWADSGECNLRLVWMKQNCPLSCNVCTPGPCEDKDKQNCAAWSEAGKCVSHSIWMLKNCRKSCMMCK